MQWICNGTAMRMHCPMQLRWECNGNTMRLLWNTINMQWQCVWEFNSLWTCNGNAMGMQWKCNGNARNIQLYSMVIQWECIAQWKCIGNTMRMHCPMEMQWQMRIQWKCNANAMGMHLRIHCPLEMQWKAYGTPRRVSNWWMATRKTPRIVHGSGEHRFWDPRPLFFDPERSGVITASSSPSLFNYSQPILAYYSHRRIQITVFASPYSARRIRLAVLASPYSSRVFLF